jgi:hypothetical protein
MVLRLIRRRREEGMSQLVGKASEVFRASRGQRHNFAEVNLGRRTGARLFRRVLFLSSLRDA